jgi:hypothetical protein
MKFKVCHSGTPKTRQQLLERLNAAAAATRNEMEMLQNISRSTK